MVQCIAEWHIKARLEDARRVREEMAEVLSRSEVPNKDAFLLASAELIVNLSRYPEPKPTDIIMTLSRDEYFWWLELKDNGPSFNRFSQDFLNPDTLEAAESGMGLKLLAQMFPDIRYIPACYREDAYNLMMLRMPTGDANASELTVLVVDDDPSYRSVLGAYLAEGYRVIEAVSVSDGFDKALRYLPDLVICDLLMPELPGTVLFDQLSHIPDVADTAFIYVSGCEDESVISRALTRPIDDFLTKPVVKSRLINTLERVVHRRRFLKDQIQLELEQKVTLGLKPHLPEQIPGYDIQLRSFNPEAGGGDLVQLHEGEKQNIILMADLMGHGLSAKGYVYALAGYLRGLFSSSVNQSIDLSDLLKRLSSCFDEDKVLKETLATLIAVSLNKEGEIEWVNAGQPYPLLIDEQGAREIYVDGSLPGLGISGYQSYRHPLEAGERLLIYSDGFNDAAVKIPDNLLSAIEDSRKMPLSSAADWILKARLDLSKLDDDLTIILIEKQ